MLFLTSGHLVSVFHPAVATFFAPSDLSGIHGMSKGVAGSKKATIGTSGNFIGLTDPLPPLLPYMAVSHQVPILILVNRV